MIKKIRATGRKIITVPQAVKSRIIPTTNAANAIQNAPSVGKIVFSNSAENIMVPEYQPPS